MKHRTGLLVTTAFVAGVAVALPASRLLVPHVPAAFAGTANSEAAREQSLTLFGQVLERVRADYVDPIKTSALIHYALNGMLSGLDPHSGYMDPQEWREMQLETEGHFGGLGMTVTGEGGMLKVIAPIDGTPAARAGIKSGDLIVSVNGKTVEGLTLEQAVDELRGPPDTQVSLTIKREGNDTPIAMTLTREIIHMEVVKSRREGDIGYVRLSVFNDDTNRGLRSAIANFRKSGKLDGVILDLRNNPGGLLDQAVAVSNDFLPGGTIVSTRGRQSDDDHTWYAHPGDLVHGVPVVVLINDGSASASEIVSGALQDNHRAVLLGTRSFGKGSVQTLFPLDNGGAIRLTTARYYTPDGHSIQNEGITPDVVVHESDKPAPSFVPEHESDLNNTLSIPESQAAPEKRPPLPVAAGLADKPPAGWPKYDPDKPDTDFQLHQAIVLLHRMIAQGGNLVPTGQKVPVPPKVARSPA
ncbi:MAG TPA: S41 family peptidase [Acetobacteraceae bacterium]|jgi:carboxyl-terminal processing protease|nr:S41 family peptidase [Acetobacteraceae bacterium]